MILIQPHIKPMPEPNPTPERSNFVQASNWNMRSKIWGGSTVSSNKYSLDCGNPLAGLDTSVLWVDPGTSWGTSHGTWQTAAFSHRSSEKALAVQRQVITTSTSRPDGRPVRASLFVHPRRSWDIISVFVTETNDLSCHPACWSDCLLGS